MIRYIASTALAGVMQIGLEAALPTDTPRLLVIMLGGLTAIIWIAFDNLILGRISA